MCVISSTTPSTENPEQKINNVSDGIGPCLSSNNQVKSECLVVFILNEFIVAIIYIVYAFFILMPLCYFWAQGFHVPLKLINI